MRAADRWPLWPAACEPSMITAARAGTNGPGTPAVRLFCLCAGTAFIYTRWPSGLFSASSVGGTDVAKFPRAATHGSASRGADARIVGTGGRDAFAQKRTHQLRQEWQIVRRCGRAPGCRRSCRAVGHAQGR